MITWNCFRKVAKAKCRAITASFGNIKPFQYDFYVTLMKLIFVFIDGIGIGASCEYNPFAVADIPFINNLAGARIVNDVSVKGNGFLLKGIDANLGIDGIPQSATGQTSLFTGQNAARLLGRHLTAYPNKPLIGLINDYSILKCAKNRGLQATFANAYTSDYFKMAERGLRFHSATTRCVFAAGIPFRFVNDLLEGNAVYWDITNSFLHKRYDSSIPVISPFLAGTRLANLSKINDLVLYECFLPDIIGHKRDITKAIEFLETFDGFLHGVISGKESGTTVLVTSDHGNIEDLSIRSHTNNPVPLLVSGPMAAQLEEVESITGVLGAIFPE